MTASWTENVGGVLHLLDPTINPAKALDKIWGEISQWGMIDGIWLRTVPGHLEPSGTWVAGHSPDNAEEIASLASPSTASINTDGKPVVARQLRDGNVPVALILVAHDDAPQPASFLVDALSRYLLDRLRMQLEASELAEENHYLRGELTPQVDQHDIVTVSGVMDKLIRSAVRAASSNATVLVQGETGTGKELLARLIHSHSTRSHKTLVTINAGALPPTLLESELFGHVRGSFTGADHDRKGVFEIAEGGTLFLDEVGELSLEAQVRLLRVLQERTVMRIGDHNPLPVDVRVIAATHRDLAREVAQGRFRQDLYYRLNVISLNVPPLRERKEDIPVLVNHFLQRFNQENYKHVENIPRPILEILCNYPWPGNIRELENCIQKAVVMAPANTVVADLIPATIRSYSPESGTAPDPKAIPEVMDTDPHTALEQALTRYAQSQGPNLAECFHEMEKFLITYALDKEKGVKLRAAKELGINRVTLDRKLDEYGITVQRGLGVIRAPITGDEGLGLTI